MKPHFYILLALVATFFCSCFIQFKDGYKEAVSNGNVGSKIIPFNLEAKPGKGIFQEINPENMKAYAKHRKLSIFRLIIAGCQPAANSVKSLSKYTDSLSSAGYSFNFKNVALDYNIGQIYGLYQFHKTTCFYILATGKGSSYSTKIKLVNQLFGNELHPQDDLFIVDTNGVLVKSLETLNYDTTQLKRQITPFLYLKAH